MIVLIFLGGLGSGFLAVTSCQAPPRASYEVTIAAAPVSTATNFSLADIAALAHASSIKAGHPPVGFYAGTFGYTIDIIRRTPSGQRPEQVIVRVSPKTLKRHIEVGQESASRICMYSVYLSHYRRHDADDVDIVEKHRHRVERTLQERPPDLRDPRHPDTPADHAGIVRLTAAAVGIALQGLSEDRAAAAGRVDTPGEIRRLEGACSDRA